MHLNYHFFKFLCPQLTEIYSGKEVLSCFSQSKGELLIEIDQAPWIRLHLKPPTIVLSFPEKFHRAKQNTRGLYKDLIGQRIQSIQEVKFDRSFFIHFRSGDRLLFKMHGNRSNVVFYPKTDHLPKEIFLTNQIEDKTLDPNLLEKNLELSYEEFERLEGNASKFLPSLGAIPRAWLKSRDYPQLTISEKWQLIQLLLDYLESPLYYIVEQGDSYDISLLPEGKYEKKANHPIQACNELHYFAVVKNSFEREKNRLIKEYSDEIKRTKAYLQKAISKLEELKKSPPPSQLADVIMANLHLFKNGKAVLHDFYSNTQIEVSLKPNQKPQEYAEKLYKKNKNRKLEWSQLEKNIAQKEAKLQDLEDSLSEIDTIEHGRDLKKYLKKEDLNPSRKKEETPLPFKIFEVDGYPIWVGKSAKANDEMLRNYTKKNDWWLHARKVAGSHVLIKTGKLSEPPEKVLHTAAALAAYYSKSKTQTLAPVIYIQAKYVRKVKGSPPGAVVVEKENVLMIEPKSPESFFKL